MQHKIGPSPCITSFAGHAGQVVTGSIQERLFIEGKSFAFEDYFTFDTDEVKTIVVDPKKFAGLNLTFDPILFSATAGPIVLDYYSGVAAGDDGTMLLGSNRRPSFQRPQTIFRINPTIIDIGTRFAGDIVPSTGVAPANSSGSSNTVSLPFELLTIIKYAVKLTNKNGAGVIVSMKVNWFES